MKASDWLVGATLAVMVGLPAGIIANLWHSIMEKPREYIPDEPLFTPRDVRRSAFYAGIFMAITTPLGAMLAGADRRDAESWQQRIRDHRCAVVDQRTVTRYQFNPATKMNQPVTETEYLWRCDDGEQWHHERLKR